MKPNPTPGMSERTTRIMAGPASLAEQLMCDFVLGVVTNHPEGVRESMIFGQVLKNGMLNPRNMAQPILDAIAFLVFQGKIQCSTFLDKSLGSTGTTVWIKTSALKKIRKQWLVP